MTTSHNNLLLQLFVRLHCPDNYFELLGYKGVTGKTEQVGGITFIY